jgi:quercetin dioxygenase-like cupin family protein
MRIFCLEVSKGQKIENYDSRNVTQSWIAHLTDNAHVSYMHIGPKGMIGYHQATIPQLLLITQGEGWVRGEAEVRTKVKAGQVAYWEAGEWHETGTETGMKAVVIEVESEEFEPAEYMKECR